MKRPKISEAISTDQIKAFPHRGIARLRPPRQNTILYIAPSSSSATILNYGGSNAPRHLFSRRSFARTTSGESPQSQHHRTNPMNTEDLLEQYSCGPVKFSGRDDALYERHLMFDQVAPTTKATAREQFEAAARSVRDVLSQRWIKTEQTYQQRNAKRVYYLSMEYSDPRE